MTTTTSAPSGETLPRWDATDLFPSPGDRATVAAVESIGADAARLRALYDRHGVDGGDPHAPSPAEGAAFVEVLGETNRVERRLAELVAYVASYVTTDSTDADAQARASEIDGAAATIRQLGARFTAWVARLGAEALIAAVPEAADHAGPLRRLEIRAEHQMAPEAESLYAELTVTGSGAWSRLHGDVTSQTTVIVELPSGPSSMPMTAVRNLAMDPDPARREAGYLAELEAWPGLRVPLAAAMNAIKGEACAVNARRGWPDALAPSLHANAVSPETFEAMQAAVDDALPDFRRWMRRKAALHGRPGGLPWYDLFAPCPVAAHAVTWAQGGETVRRAFRAYSPALAGLADRALRESWIDAPPRPGKRGGAFCMPLVGDRSLVLLNWAGSAESVQTLAHELGHAYHNTQLAHRTPLQRRLPMALAETASIFCETLVTEEGLAEARGPARLALLDTDLVGVTQVVVDIRSRFLFERRVFARRAQRALSPAELCDLMVEAQREAYGGGLADETVHPYMWAVKPHYYSSHFYNWPYTFGLLFGLGLFARYRQDPERFRAGYDDVLSRAGMATAEELGADFGVDVTDGAFWTASLDTIRARMADYAVLAAAGHGDAPSAR